MRFYVPLSWCWWIDQIDQFSACRVCVSSLVWSLLFLRRVRNAFLDTHFSYMCNDVCHVAVEDYQQREEVGDCLLLDGADDHNSCGRLWAQQTQTTQLDVLEHNRTAACFRRNAPEYMWSNRHRRSTRYALFRNSRQSLFVRSAKYKKSPHSDAPIPLFSRAHLRNLPMRSKVSSATNNTAVVVTLQFPIASLPKIPGQDLSRYPAEHSAGVGSGPSTQLVDHRPYGDQDPDPHQGHVFAALSLHLQGDEDNGAEALLRNDEGIGVQQGTGAGGSAPFRPVPFRSTNHATQDDGQARAWAFERLGTRRVGQNCRTHLRTIGGEAAHQVGWVLRYVPEPCKTGSQKRTDQSVENRVDREGSPGAQNCRRRERRSSKRVHEKESG